MKNKLAWIIACGLIFCGITKPNFNQLFCLDSKISDNYSAPSDSKIKQRCKDVVDALQKGGAERSKDGKRLAGLFADIATLISLDGEDEIIKTTEELKYVNTLSGPMLKMNIKGKYPNLVTAAQSVITTAIGDDSVVIDKNMRSKAVDAFNALAWACNEGSK